MEDAAMAESMAGSQKAQAVIPAGVPKLFISANVYTAITPAAMGK
jgi:hypothetical protein